MQTLTQKQTRWALIIALVVFSMSGISTDLYAPSLPHIAQYFHTSISAVQLTMTTFLIGFGVGQIPFGTASDIWGRKWPLFLGVMVYTLISISALFAQHIGSLLFIRFVQGICCAAPSAISKAIVNESFEGVTRKRNMTSLSTVWGLGPIIAPFIGGYLQHYFGWKAGFVFFTVYGLILSAGVFFKLRETNTHHVEPKFKTLLKHYRCLLTNGKFLCLGGMQGTGYSLLLVVNVIAPFLIERTLKHSAIVYGHTILFVGLIFFLGTLTNRKLVKHFRTSHLMAFSTYAFVACGILQVILAYTLPLSLFTVAFPVACFAFFEGISYPVVVMTVMKTCPNITGIAAAFSGTISLVICAVLTAIATLVPTSTGHGFAWFYFFTAIAILLLFIGVRLQTQTQ